MALETCKDLFDAIGNQTWQELPVVAKTPHGTYTFQIERIEVDENGDEPVAILRLTDGVTA